MKNQHGILDLSIRQAALLYARMMHCSVNRAIYLVSNEPKVKDFLLWNGAKLQWSSAGRYIVYGYTKDDVEVQEIMDWIRKRQ